MDKYIYLYSQQMCFQLIVYLQDIAMFRYIVKYKVGHCMCAKRDCHGDISSQRHLHFGSNNNNIISPYNYSSLWGGVVLFETLA